jgi:hypothetical protein
VQVHGEIIIDALEYFRATGSFSFIAGTKYVPIDEVEDDSFSEDEMLLFFPGLYGFSLTSKCWCVFFVWNIKDLEYSNTAFESLVIPQHQKMMIRSLVNDHQNEHSTFDDLIEGKGKGLIFLLHGPPGVGKTLTAESLSHFTQRPLYTLGGADFGGGGVHVENTLTKALQLSSRWNALILVDEADVFMEERRSHNLFHNELVAGMHNISRHYRAQLISHTSSPSHTRILRRHHVPHDQPR